MSKSFVRSGLQLALLAAVALVGSAQAVGVSGQGTWETTLKDRDLDGNGVTDAFYDTVLNITWLRNANVNGLMTWPTANDWANNLVFGDYSDWRLPWTIDTGGGGCDLLSNAGGLDCGFNVHTADSAMAHLWYETLGNLAYCPPGDVDCNPAPQPGWGLTNTGNFESLEHDFDYWSGGLVRDGSSFHAWFFGTVDGFQAVEDRRHELYAMAVRPGDVAATAVPEPGGPVLALTALGALALVRRRRPHVEAVIDPTTAR